MGSLPILGLKGGPGCHRKEVGRDILRMRWASQPTYRNISCSGSEEVESGSAVRAIVCLTYIHALFREHRGLNCSKNLLIVIDAIRGGRSLEDWQQADIGKDSVEEKA